METNTIQESDQILLLRFTEPREVRPFTVYKATITTIKAFFNSIFAQKAGNTNQDFSIQKLSLPNEFTIETDADYLYVKKKGTICSKVSLTAHSAPDHQEL